MAADKSAQEGEDAAALAAEVKALRGFLEALQAQLTPAMQSSLRERSDELQRLGGELAERTTEVERLQAALDAESGRASELEREAERWRDAARRGLDEIAERVRAAQARFELETAELNGALTAARAELAAKAAEADAAVRARDEATALAERRDRRIRALRAKVIGREQRRMRMTRSVSWRITAPLRWIPAALRRLLRRGARLRRKVMGR